MKAAKVLRWPAEMAVLTLRCVGCGHLFDVYPGDEALVTESLCPACFIEQRYPKERGGSKKHQTNAAKVNANGIAGNTATFTLSEKHINELLVSLPFATKKAILQSYLAEN